MRKQTRGGAAALLCLCEGAKLHAETDAQGRCCVTAPLRGEKWEYGKWGKESRNPPLPASPNSHMRFSDAPMLSTSGAQVLSGSEAQVRDKTLSESCHRQGGST